MTSSNAEAGPSVSITKASTGDGPVGLQNFRQIYYTLEAAASSVPGEVLHARLRQLVPKLKASCDPLPRASSASAAKVDSGSITTPNGEPVALDKALQDVVKRCASLLDVDEVEMALAMRTYLDSDEVTLDHLTEQFEKSDSFSSSLSSSTRKSGKHLTRSGLHRTDVSSSLIDALSIFFFEERLYALRCINALLRIGDDNFHEINAIAEDIVRQIVDQPFALHCLSRMESVCNDPLNEKLREVPRYGTFWAKYGLRHQLALLEIVFLTFYSRLESSASFVKSVHLIVNRTDFGRRQVNAGFFDAEASSMLDCIVHLLVLLCIESLDLERVIDGLDLISSPSSQNTSSGALTRLVDSPEVVEEVIIYLRTSTVRDHVRGPLLIAWALIVSRIDTAYVDWREARPTEPLPNVLKGLVTALDHHGGPGSLWPELVSAALTPEIDLFGTMENVVRSPLVSWHTGASHVIALALSSSLAMRAVFKGLVMCITELVRPEYVQDYAGLIQVWQRTFTNEDVDHRIVGQISDSAAALCAQFWQVDYEFDHRRSVLTAATRRFPVSFRPLIGLCRALSGSGPGAIHSSDEALQASSAVVSYLASVDTITQVLDTRNSLTLPYEPVRNSAEDTLTYRTTRAVPVFGRHLVVPIGTLGRMISVDGQNPVIMVWQLSDEEDDEGVPGENSSYSVWRLMRDVLAQFAGLLDRKDEFTADDTSNDASVFVEHSASAKFADLAPDEHDTFDGDVASDIMDLFASILATQSSPATFLLSHLEGEDLPGRSRVQLTAHANTRPSLITITLAILNQALAVPNSASNVIISSYRLLTLALSTAKFEDVWLPLRSSGLLTGVYGALSYSVESVSRGVSLLAYETSIGKYAGLLSMLNFHHALLADVQQSCYALSSTDSELKVDILLRTLDFIAQKVWIVYQGWKYARIRQRIEVGRKCVQIFARILQDDTLLYASLATARLRNAVEGLFVSESTTLSMLSPLLTVIASAPAYISSLQRSSRQLEVEMARDQVESCVRLASLMVLCRRRHTTAGLGMLERAFIEEGALTKAGGPQTAHGRSRESGIHSIELASVLINGLFSSQLTAETKIEMTKLITIVSSAIVDNADRFYGAPSLVSRLGSLTDVGSIFGGLVSLTSDESGNVELRVGTIDMLAALIRSQPGIATLLLTGKHVASLAGQEEQKDTAITMTAPEAAAKLVEDVKDFSECSSNQLRVTEASLKLLTISWEHAAEHRTEFGKLRQSKTFWNAVMRLVNASFPAPSTNPARVDVGSGGPHTDCDTDVVRFSLLKSCSARALHLLEADIRVSPSFEQKPSSSTASPPSLLCVFDLLKQKTSLMQILTPALQFHCDPLRHIDVAQRIEQTFPELRLDDFRLPARIDDFDHRKRFGCDHVFDVDSLRFKLEGLWSASAESNMNANVINQAILLVAGINLEWSLIDAQSTYLRAWTSLLSATIGPLFDHMDRDEVLKRDVRRTIGQIWPDCARIVADEELATDIVRDIHVLRVSLLAVLLECAWGRSTVTQANRQLQHDYANDEDETALSVLQQAVRIVTHPQLSIEDFMLKAPLNGFRSVHQDAARIILVCSQRYRAARKGLEGAKGLEAERLRNLQRCAETLVVQTITCMRISLDRCLLASNSPLNRVVTNADDNEGEDGNADGFDLDLQLFASSLAILLHRDSKLSVHIWLPKLHSSDLLQTSFELFSRSTITEFGEESLASAFSPAYWNTLLDLYLDLACQESTCEPLILAGVMNALSTNCLSQQLDAMAVVSTSKSGVGSIPPRIGQGAFAENALHTQWIKMLRVVVALISTLDGAHQLTFVRSEVTSFYRIFYPVVEATLDRALMNAVAIGSAFGVRQSGSNTIRRPDGKISASDAAVSNQLVELELMTGLCMYMIRAHHSQYGRTSASSPAQKEFLDKIVGSFVRRSTVRLQESVHLLQHPHELLAFLGVDKMSAGERKDPFDQAVRHLVQASMNIVETFWTLSEGLEVLCSSDANDWSVDEVLFVPTIGTSPNRPSSTGTLLDLATYLGDTLRSVKDEQLSHALIAALEQTVSLATVQLALCLHGKPTSDAATKLSLANSAQVGGAIDVEAGLGRDVAQATESAKSVLQQSGAPTAFLDIVGTFQRRWLVSSE